VITGQAAVQRCNATVNFLDEVKPFYPPNYIEDFSFYQEVMSGFFFWLGMKNASHEQVESLHSPYFTINEDGLPYGAALHASLAASYLLKYQHNVPGMEGKFHDEL
ncbi:putative IAA-amino acid hydrolase ILR1-like 4, partial [Sesbania bispinosa]